MQARIGDADSYSDLSEKPKIAKSNGAPAQNDY